MHKDLYGSPKGATPMAIWTTFPLCEQEVYKDLQGYLTGICFNLQDARLSSIPLENSMKFVKDHLPLRSKPCFKMSEMMMILNLYVL